MSDGWSCRMVSVCSFGRSGSAVHDVCTLYAGAGVACVVSIRRHSAQFTVYVHGPQSTARLGHPSQCVNLKIGTVTTVLSRIVYVGRTLGGLKLHAQRGTCLRDETDRTLARIALQS